MQIDYYKILGISKDATKEEIKSAYKNLAKKYHPDLNKSKDAADRFKEVNEAYYVLRDSEFRKKYDKEYSHIKIRTDLDKEHCNYHLCQKRTLTIKCEYCRNFFCMKHNIPHPPFSFWERIKLGIPDNVHPCPYCPPCPHCPKKYHPEPYINPYTTKVKPEEPEPPTKPPKPEKNSFKLFVSKVYDTSFNIGFNNNIRNSLHNLRKDVLKKNTISEHEIQKILNDLIFILKNNSFEKKLDNACYKFVKKIYEVYSIDVFSYWNDIYKEAKKEPTKPPKIKSVYYVFGLALLLLIGLLFYFASATTITLELKNISSTKTVTSLENVSNKISFFEYLNDIYASDKQKVILNGFLERSIEGDGNAGVHVFLVVDDYNNRVILDWSYNDLKKYLPDLGKTKELYSVQGIFKREYKTLKLNVENINLYKREPAKQVEVNNVVSYTEQITINRTSPKYPLVRNWVFKLIGKEILCEDDTNINSCSDEKPLYCSINGLKEEPQKCGCPSGKRIYKNQCINEVKCSDGTFEPECSKNKPKQCVDGKLVDNPEGCGCPENYKLKDKKCVYIRCSDGTIEPDCSTKMKMQCIEGSFVYNSNKCGCPDGYVKRGNNCVKTCSDGTAYDECSDENPIYCDNGALVNKASISGCPSGSKYKQSGELCLDLSNPDVGYIEEKVHELVNVQRQTNGLSKLSYDTKLVQVARAHSQDMATNNFFSHDNLRGEDPTDRANKIGYNCRKDYGSYYTEGIAENIHQGWTYETTWYTNGVESSKEWLIPDEIAESAVTGWMNSPGHRKNILTNTYDKEGIGVAVASNGAVYITQDFC